MMSLNRSRLQVLVDVGVVVAESLIVQLIVEVEILRHEELCASLMPVPFLPVLSVLRFVRVYS